MAHHSDENMSQAMRDLFTKGEKPTKHLIEEKMRRMQAAIDRSAAENGLGATGDFQEGKLDSSDEGAIKVGIAEVRGKVVLNFGTQVVWIGFDAEQARDVAQLLLNAARDCDGIEAHVRRVMVERGVTEVT